MITYLNYFTLTNIVDIIFVAIVAYKLIMLIKGTRAVQLIKGLVLLLIFTTISDWLGLYTIHWLLKNTMTMVFVALPVVFQPELRRALERLGRGDIFGSTINLLGNEDKRKLIDEIVKIVQIMSKNRMGVLIVFEREIGINEYIETGTKIDGIVTGELLINIFTDKTPLHDGAVIIREERIVAAGCLLPLSEHIYLSKDLGTRHRAALGITEVSDSLAVVVSEETGSISLAVEGKLTRYLDESNLRDMLENLLLAKQNKQRYFWNRG